MTKINYVSRNQLHNTTNGCQILNFWLSTFEFQRKNIAGCCKETFHFQFNIKLIQSKTWFFQFSQCLAEWVGCKNSNFFKLAVLRSDSMEQNYEGLTFNIPDIFDLRQQWFEAKKLWNPRLCPLPPVTLNHLCNSSSAYARMFIATKLRVAFRAQASASQRCVTLRNLQFASNLWSQCTSRFDDFFCFVLPVCLRIYTQISSCAIKVSNSA